MADRHLVNRVTPGTRVRVTGIYSVTRGGGLSKGAPAGAATLQQPYLRLVDISEESEGHKEDDFRWGRGAAGREARLLLL